MIPDLLALDLDGTLLPRTKVLTERSRAAVSGVHRAGGQVLLATGKTFHLTSRYADELGLEGPQITLDGALVRTHPEGETLRSTGVPAERVREAAGLLAGLDLLPFLADADDRLVVHSGLESWLDFLGAYATRVATSPRPLDEARGDPFFYALLGDRSEAARGEDRIRSLGENGLDVFRASFFSRDIDILVLRPRTDKGEALAFVADYLGIGMDRVAAVGDWRNDLGMLRRAGLAVGGLAVAMADSHPSLIEEADVVLPGGCDSDALARFLESLCP